MRHQRVGKKLGRDSAHRKALYSNLAGALIEHGRIKTTVTKAKAVKPIAEQMITLGRRGDLHARRQATAFLRSRDVVHKLFAEVAPRFKDRPGGTRGSSRSGRGPVTPLGWRISVSTRSTSPPSAKSAPGAGVVRRQRRRRTRTLDTGADESADDGDDDAAKRRARGTG